MSTSKTARTFSGQKRPAMPKAKHKFQIRTRSGGEQKWRLLLIAFTLRLQELTGAWDGETLLIKKLLNSQNILNVLAAIHPLPSAAFHGVELGELGFPKAQHVGGQVTEASHFADTEIKLLRD